MTDLSQLIERVQAATEGSRELDAEVYEAVVGLRMYESIHERGGDLCLRYYPGPPGPEYGRLPRYTTSLDAVMSLMPEGYVVDGLTISPKEGCSVKVLGTHLKKDGRRWRGSDDGHWSGEGPTAPLALLAAVLRARQTEGRHD